MSREMELVGSSKYLYAVDGMGKYTVPKEDEYLDGKFREDCRSALVEVGILDIDDFKSDFERLDKTSRTTTHSLHFVNVETTRAFLGKLIAHFQNAGDEVHLHTTEDGNICVEKTMPSGTVVKVIYKGYAYSVNSTFVDGRLPTEYYRRQHDWVQ